MLACLLPSAQIPMCTEYFERVVCTDASPDRHGMAYSFVPRSTVESWARFASLRGDSTSLAPLGSDGAEVRPEAEQRLRKVCLPLGQRHWHEIPRAGFFRHTSIEEFAAANWGLESRFHRPSEPNKKVCR